MTDKDKDKFCQLIVTALLAHSREPDEASLVFWWSALRDFEYAEIREAVLHFTGAFFNPASIRKSLEQRRPSPEYLARQAFSQALKAVQKYGANYSIIFDDTILAETIQQMGGWVTFCNLPLNEWDEKRFLEIYSDIARYGAKKQTVKLIGRHERHNGARAKDLRLIGDQDKCLKLLEASKRSGLSARNVLNQLERIPNE